MEEKPDTIGFIIKKFGGKVSIRINNEVYPNVNKVAKRLRENIFIHLTFEQLFLLIENAKDESFEISEADAIKWRDHLRGCAKCQNKSKTIVDVVNLILSRSQKSEEAQQ